MGVSYNKSFEDDVKRLLRNRVQVNDVQALPLPKGAQGGQLDMDSMRVSKNITSALNTLDTHIKKWNPFSKILAPDELTKTAYEQISKVVNQTGISQDLRSTIQGLTADGEIGKELGSTFDRLFSELEEIQNKPVEPWYISGKELFKVEGIPDEIPYFTALNGEMVWKLPKGVKPEKPVYDLLKHDLKRDVNGSIVTKSATKPGTSEYICSKKNLKIPFNQATKYGYGYVHFYIDDEGERVFIYFVPKKVLYPIQQLALVVTKKTSMKAYEMVPYNTWQFGKVALCVIPYNPRENYVMKSTKVLATAYGHSVQGVYNKHFRDKQEQILNTWMQANILGKISDYEIEDSWGDKKNLLVEDSKVTLNQEDYKGMSSVNLEDAMAQEIAQNGAFKENELDDPEDAPKTNDAEDDWGDDDWDW